LITHANHRHLIKQQLGIALIEDTLYCSGGHNQSTTLTRQRIDCREVVMTSKGAQIQGNWDMTNVSARAQVSPHHKYGRDMRHVSWCRGIPPPAPGSFPHSGKGMSVGVPLKHFDIQKRPQLFGTWVVPRSKK
jgi:hypothetical protein